MLPMLVSPVSAHAATPATARLPVSRPVRRMWPRAGTPRALDRCAVPRTRRGPRPGLPRSTRILIRTVQHRGSPPKPFSPAPPAVSRRPRRGWMWHVLGQAPCRAQPSWWWMSWRPMPGPSWIHRRRRPREIVSTRPGRHQLRSLISAAPPGRAGIRAGTWGWLLERGGWSVTKP